MSNLKYFDSVPPGRIKQRERWAKDPEKRRLTVLKTRFRKLGVPMPNGDLPELPEFCEICKTPFDASCVINIDHDHKTGKFRGWLCRNCNTGLGQFRDNPRLLKAALIYIRDRQ